MKPSLLYSTVRGGGRYLRVDHRDHQTEYERVGLALSVLESFPGLIFVKNREHKIVYANTYFLRILNLHSINDIIGKLDKDLGFPEVECSHFWHDDDKILSGAVTAQVISAYENLTVQSEEGSKTLTLYTVKMPIRAGAVEALPGPEAEQTYVLGISWVRNERNEAWEELMKAKQLWETMMKYSSDAIYLKDQYGRYEIANDVFVRMRQVPREQLIGQTAEAVWRDHPKLVERIKEEDRKIKQTKEPLGPQIRDIPTRTGGTELWSSHKIPIIGASGEVSGIVGISRELSSEINASVARRIGVYQPPGRMEEEPAETYIAVAFCDIRGFSQVAADNRLNSEDVMALISPFNVALLDTAARCGVTISQLLGDGAMLLHLAEDSEKGRRNAVRSLVDFALMVRPVYREEVRKWKLERRRRLVYVYDLELGLGINFGKATVGTFNHQVTEDRQKGQSPLYTAYGETVNMAQRLESVAGKNGLGHILLSLDAADCVEGLYDMNHLSGITSDKPSCGTKLLINAYEVMGARLRSATEPKDY